jgi:hypothetical protein
MAAGTWVEERNPQSGPCAQPMRLLAEDDDVPPLEDMAEDLAFRAKFAPARTPKAAAAAPPAPIVAPVPAKSVPPEAKPKTSGGYGGLSKGFLLSATASKAEAKPADHLPTIKAKDPKARPGVLPEVQQQLAAAEGYLKKNRAGGPLFVWSVEYLATCSYFRMHDRIGMADNRPFFSAGIAAASKATYGQP